MPAKLRSGASAKLISLGVILTLAVVGLVALGGAEAASEQPKCGDTITTDTTLHRSLFNCPSNGIVVGADDVTLDLNYHTIDGDGTAVADCDTLKERCDVGVDIEGHDGVTVVNGSVREFEDGVVARTARHTRLLGVSSSSNHIEAMVVSLSDRSVVRNSSGIGSTNDIGDGILVVLSDGVRIVHSSFRGNGSGGHGVGIDVFESTHMLIAGNRLSGNKGAGILLDGDDNRVSRNRSVRDGEVGIWVLAANGNVISRNRVSRLRQSGEVAALQVTGGDHNVLARNSVRHSEGDAIGVAGSVIAEANVVRPNHARGAGGGGVGAGGAGALGRERQSRRCCAATGWATRGTTASMSTAAQRS